MMRVLAMVLASGTFRRFLAMAVTAAIIAGNKRLGLNLEAAELGALVATVLVYVAQSAMRQGRAPTFAELVEAVTQAITQAQEKSVGPPGGSGATPPSSGLPAVVGRPHGERLR